MQKVSTPQWHSLQLCRCRVCSVDVLSGSSGAACLCRKGLNWSQWQCTQVGWAKKMKWRKEGGEGIYTTLRVVNSILIMNLHHYISSGTCSTALCVCRGQGWLEGWGWSCGRFLSFMLCSVLTMCYEKIPWCRVQPSLRKLQLRSGDRREFHNDTFIRVFWKRGNNFMNIVQFFCTCGKNVI